MSVLCDNCGLRGPRTRRARFCAICLHKRQRQRKDWTRGRIKSLDHDEAARIFEEIKRENRLSQSRRS